MELKLFSDCVNKEGRVVPISFKTKWSVDNGSHRLRTAVIAICLKIEICYLLQVTGFEQLPQPLVQLLSHENVRLILIPDKRYVELVFNIANEYNLINFFQLHK